MGMRAGFVYKTEDNLIDDLSAGPRPATRTPCRSTSPTSASTAVAAPRTIAIIPMLGFPTAQAAQFPDQRGRDERRRSYSRYKTVEVSMNKRYGNRWSGSVGVGYTMLTDFPNGYPQNPNQPGVEDRTNWNFKASGSYDAPWRHPHLAGAASPVGRRTTRAR